MTESPIQAGWRHGLAALWLLLVLCSGWQSSAVLRGERVVVDLFALLPEREDDALRELALRRAVQDGEHALLFLLGGVAEPALSQAEARFREALDASGLVAPQHLLSSAALQEAVQFYRPWRSALIDPERESRLQAPQPQQLQQGLARLLQPLPAALGLAWQDDPFGHFAAWWQARASGLAAEATTQGLRLDDHGQRWAVLPYRLRGEAFALDGEGRLGAAVGAAEAAAGTVAPGLRLLRAGVPLHADAAAARAAWEVSTIGLGSLLAVLVLVWAAFRSLRPIVLVTSSLLIGCAVGLACTLAVFGEVHVLTLVFGASLVGVAEDYGIHYFSARQARPEASSSAILQALRPSLWLALITSVLAYLALGAVPFPGLRQMAVFSAAGLIGAFATVVLWFPLLDRRPPRPSSFARWLQSWLPRLPALRPATAGALALLILTLSAWPWQRLTVSDDLRQLQGSPAELLAMQVEVGRLLQLPSPAQLFLLRSDSAEALLQREEWLTAELRVLRANGVLSGWQALSDWLPSQARQHALRSRLQPIESALQQAAREWLGELPAAAPTTDAPLDWASFAASPLPALVPGLLFGRFDDRYYSVVRLSGLRPDRLAELRALHAPEHGLSWVDRTADYGALLGHYRERMAWLLVLGYFAVGLALAWRFRTRAWRAWLPTGLAGVIALSALSLLGQPLTLFSVLALLLLLGIGVDYGIFLLEHADGAAWMAVVLGATSTLLAFGLLGLSATPALRAFGLTLLFGIGAVAVLSPLFRSPATMPAP